MMQNIIEDNFKNVISRRKSIIYKPLGVGTVTKIRQQREKSKAIRKILEIVGIVVFLILIAAIFYNKYIWNHDFHINNHVKTMVQLNRGFNVEHFSDVTNRSQFLDFVMNDFVNTNTFYITKWYNLFNLQSADLQQVISWTEDYTQLLFGFPILRQLRVLPNSCKINKLVADTLTECIPPWSTTVEDTDMYSFGWNPSLKIEDRPTPWQYQLPSESEFPRLHSVTGITYHTGGYVAMLGMTRYDTNLLLRTLLDGHWIDQYTRVVYIYLALYNVNTNMYSQVTLVAEHLPTGFYVTKAVVESFAPNILDILWNALIIVYMIILSLRTIISIDRYGLRKFMSEYRNVYQVVLASIGLLTIVSFVIYMKLLAAYIAEFHDNESHSIFYFSGIIYYNTWSNMLSILFSYCVVIRLFTLWRYGRVYLWTVFTLKSTLVSSILICIYIIVLCSVHWNVINNLNLVIFSRASCHLKWSLTLQSHQCLGESEINFIFFLLVKLGSFVMLIYTITQYKVVKYKST